MWSVYIVLVLGLCSVIPGSQARPRDKSHRGLYDDVKITPFVDEKVEDSESDYRHDWTKLGNDDESFNKYNKIYDLYNKHTGRTVAENENQDSKMVTTEKKITIASESDDNESVDTSSLPVEGGIEEEEDDNDRSGKLDTDGEKRHRHGKSRTYRIHPHDGKHHNKIGQGLKKDNTVNTDIKLDTDNLPDERVDLFKFLDEDPEFKKNVGIITDSKTEDPKLQKTDFVQDESNNLNLSKDENNKQGESEVENKDDAVPDDDDSDTSDDKDSTDSDVDEDEDSDESKDLSSEMYDDAYEYYDGDEESSYSSSEMAENKNIHGEETPYDWFKEYDKVFGDQDSSKTEVDDLKQTTHKEKNDEDSKSFDYSDYVNDAPVTNSFYENIRKSVDNRETEVIDKTDSSSLVNSDSTLEPSTSPNPPTGKKVWKPMVTQPAHSERKHNTDYVTYIESRPVEACDVDWDCPPGRYCKFGLCICGHADLCEGHNKPVCGSDGTLYPSHCELHRTACVKGIHIKLAERKNCKTDMGTDSVDTVIDGHILADKHNTEESNFVDGEPKKVKDIAIAYNQETLKGTEIDKEAEVKDVTLGILGTDAVKQSVDVQITGSLDNNENEDKLVNTESSMKSTLNADNDKESLEHDSKEVAEESAGDHDGSLNDSNDETDESMTKKEKTDVESKESAEKVPPVNEDKKSSKEDERVSIGKGTDKDKPSLVPLFCTPDKYMEFKAKVLQYHCLFFEEPNCDRQTQEDKHKLAAVMFNYFDHNYNGRIEKEELWKMQLRENVDQISTLCTLLDIVTFDELGTRDEKLSPEEFIQAFDIPDLLEHRLEVVPLWVTIGNALEVKCDVTFSRDIIWRRDGMDLGLLNFPGISVLGDGSLYIERVGAHLVGNITCHDRNKPSVKQVHILTVQQPPHVMVSPEMSEHHHHSHIELLCHAEGLPKPIIEWQFNNQAVEHGEKYYIHSYDNSLTVMDADYLEDSGVYTCTAHNQAGMAQASATVTVFNPNDTLVQEFSSNEESFIIFHDDGYSMHEPSKCLSQRHVRPDFGNFYIIPDELDEAPSMCEKGVPCIWGSSVNVQNRFVYVTQPRENRVLVIDVKDTLNPHQVIPTDHMPVSLYYLSHLDEVWLLCWNGEEDGGTKTILVIRGASKNTQHHTIHTQPIGNRFDMVQDIFLPPDSELHHPWRYGYTVHNGQQGLFKLDLVEKKYLKAIDFTMYQCVPKAVAFIPLGGQVLVKCVKSSSFADKEILIQMDYITDVIISNRTMSGTPYVTPDSRNVVIVDEHSGQIKVFTVTDHGEISDEFDLTVGSPVNSATFLKASFNQGYDLYLTSLEASLFSVSLLNGRIDVIKDIGTPDSDLFLPWFQKSRPLVGGDLFSNFLSTTSMSRMVIFNGKHRSIQCDFIDLDNPLVIAYTRLTNI